MQERRRRAARDVVAGESHGIEDRAEEAADEGGAESGKSQSSVEVVTRGDHRSQRYSHSQKLIFKLFVLAHHLLLRFGRHVYSGESTVSGRAGCVPN